MQTFPPSAHWSHCDCVQLFDDEMPDDEERREEEAAEEGVTQLEFGLLQAQRDMSQVRPALTQVSYSPLFAHGIEEETGQEHCSSYVYSQSDIVGFVMVSHG